MLNPRELKPMNDVFDLSAAMARSGISSAPNPQISHQTLEEMITSTFQSGISATYVIDKTVRRMYDRIYSDRIESLLPSYSLNDTLSIMQDAVVNYFKFHELNEETLAQNDIIEQKEDFELTHVWNESIEPLTPKMDKSACCNVNVDYRIQPVITIVQEDLKMGLLSEGLSPLNSRLNPSSRALSVASTIKKSVMGKGVLSLLKKSSTLKEPEVISLPETKEFIEKDTEIKWLRQLVVKRDAEKAWSKKLLEQNAKLRKLEEAEKRSHFDKIKDKQFTYNYEGQLIQIENVNSEKLPDVSNTCSFKLKKDSPYFRVRNDTANSSKSFGKYQLGLNKMKEETKEGSRWFVTRKMIGEGSNFEDMHPKFEGVTITEGEKVKRGSISVAQMFGAKRVSKEQYETQLSNLPSLPPIDQNNNRETPIEDEEDIQEVNENVSMTDRDLVAFLDSGKRSITLKENLGLREIMQSPRSYKKSKLMDFLEYPKSYIPQIPRKENYRARIVAPGSQSTVKLLAPRNANDLEINEMKVQNSIDLFNRDILNNKEWGINTIGMQRKHEKTIYKPRYKDYARSLPTLKKLPRERQYLAKSRNLIDVPTQFRNSMGQI